MSRPRLRARGLRAGVLAGLLAATGLAGGFLATPTSGATPTPEPSPTVTLEPLPDAVTAWFAEAGLEAAREAELGVDTDALVVGRPRQVALWTAGYIAGDPAADPAQTVEEWVAPVTAPPEEDGEDRLAVGVVWAGSDDGAAPEVIDVLTGTDLATALQGQEGPAVVVRDTGLDGWFAVADGEVWPLDESARTVLQGSLAVDVFQGFVHQRLGEPTAGPAPLPEPEADDGLSPLVPITVIVVLGAGGAWLLVRQYRRDDSRIAADVRAGVSPPRHEELDR